MRKNVWRKKRFQKGEISLFFFYRNTAHVPFLFPFVEFLPFRNFFPRQSAPKKCVKFIFRYSVSIESILIELDVPFTLLIWLTILFIHIFLISHFSYFFYFFHFFFLSFRFCIHSIILWRIFCSTSFETQVDSLKMNVVHLRTSDKSNQISNWSATRHATLFHVVARKILREKLRIFHVSYIANTWK